MNQLPARTVARINALAHAGKTLRAIARDLRIAKNTVSRYYPYDSAFCECGQPAGHQGWCAIRYRESLSRQQSFGGKPREFVPIVTVPNYPFVCIRCGAGHIGLYIRCGPRVRAIVMAEEVPRYGRFAAMCQHCQREMGFKGSIIELLISDIKRYGRHIAAGRQLWSYANEQDADYQDTRTAPEGQGA